MTTALYYGGRLKAEQVTAQRLSSFRDDIQGIRGLAVLMVVLGHIGFTVYGGVDISFVLSGFLATDSTLRESERANAFTAREYVTKFVPKYYARRIRRVMPMASIVIGVTVLFALLLAPAHRIWSFGWDGVWAALSGINYRLALDGVNYFNHKSATMTPFLHYWSLAVEEQFYLVFPWVFLLLFLLGRRLGSTRIVLGIGFLMLGGASLYASMALSGDKLTQSWAYFSLHTRAWELLIGCFVALGTRQFARMWRPFAAIMSWAGLAVIAVGSVMISHSTSVPGSVMLWPTIGVAMFIAGGCTGTWYGAEFLFGAPKPAHRIWMHLAHAVRVVPKTLQFLGQVSYGWYLWHWAPLMLLPYVLGRPLTLVEKMTCVLLTLALAIFTNRVVEVPIKRARFFTEFPREGVRLGYRCIAVTLAVVGIVLAMNFPTGRPKQDVEPVNPAYITKLLQESVAVNQLPASAKKQLGYIKNDLHPGCIVDVPETQAKSCSLGDPNGSGQYVLFGSSLAWQWIPTVNKLAKQNGEKLAVITKAGCPPENYDIVALDSKGKGENKAYSECGPWRKNAYALIDSLKPKLVILSSRAEKQVTPKAIRDAVNHFEGIGAKVVVVFETPYAELGANDDVPDCLARNPDAIDKCTTRIGPRPAKDMVARAAREAGATVIDPTPWLCVNSQCPAVVDGKVVYWDDHHLTATMTQWLSLAFEQKMPKLENSKK